MVKDFSSKMVKQLEDLNFPCLEHFLSTKYAFSSSKYICEFCDYVAKNQSAMSAHKRGCKTKNVNSNETNMSNKTENNNTELTTNQNIQSSTLNVVEQTNVSIKEKQTKKSVKK